MLEINTYGNAITIRGNIKSIEHYNQIKNVVDDMVGHNKNIIIKLIDSISLTSSVIGYFSKLINVDGVHLELHVKDDSLAELLNDLGLQSTFNIRRLS